MFQAEVGSNANQSRRGAIDEGNHPGIVCLCVWERVRV